MAVRREEAKRRLMAVSEGAERVCVSRVATRGVSCA